MVQKLIDYYLKRLELEQKEEGGIFKRIPSMRMFVLSILLNLSVLAFPAIVPRMVESMIALSLWCIAIVMTSYMMRYYNDMSDRKLKQARVERFKRMKGVVSGVLEHDYHIHRSIHIRELADLVAKRVAPHENRYSLDAVYLTVFISSSISILNSTAELQATLKFLFVFSTLILFVFVRYLVSFFEIVSNKRFSQLGVLHEIMEELYVERLIEESRVEDQASRRGGPGE
ncbi:hypothetical protein [Exiguobacterium sp. s28]|uniref:hypothetical protein n=1 Tax=Exiguobacterium sp. s28 TaxID=2751238 RepID=UPI001BE93D98|nr:hypothetical protein [Exiguobacterium sp. s28]